jgi:hypothetical protein
MAERPVEPFAVAQLVETYATDQHREVAKYTNRELLDESGIYDLHTLAARIYALGFNEGAAVEGWRKVEQRNRIKDFPPAPETTGGTTNG